MEKTIEQYKRLNNKDTIVQLTKEELDCLMIEAKGVLPNLVARYAKSMNIEYDKVFIKSQKTRWGSCSDRGNISLNCLLMRVPPYVRKYVIIHELAHRKVMNHSSDFWAVVAKEMPNYRKAIKWLKNNGDTFIEQLGA